MRVPLALLLAILALPRPAAAGGDFDALEAAAERVDALEPFLARYVGRCPDSIEKRVCLENVAAARRSVAGKTFVVRIPDATSLVKPQLRDGAFLLLFTPFVDGGGLALTHGAPTGQDRAGQPLIGLIPIKGTVPPGVMDLEFESPFRTGAVELEIVFRPERTWKLARKGEAGSYEGVAARFLGVRLIDARTGTPIVAKVL
ncbi:DUF6066 family protein [Anaeromyxobacter oryzae]|uniref:Uncharacterized protein n=1 Tax=Anaeromyxobacter oryzae TaxID=2918170 RepID=A0ABN6N250_9BACT|nr:DUF6066 family protein [Anaeromyxobacter oryzae]BDG06625.1 hypothetical protein AMOR_56210 [Anaeromyxobacter oryzae]